MEKAFTLVEVMILFVIFTLVAILVIPMSIDDTMQARNIAKWKHAESGLSEIPLSIKTLSHNRDMDLQSFVTALVKIHPLKDVISYRIKDMNGDAPKEDYQFTQIYNTDNGATIAFRWLDDPMAEPETNRQILGILMYDVNAKKGPNVWGKDVFGMNIYKDKIEPFGQGKDDSDIEFDCSRQGTGLYCSSYYLQGGSF